MRQLRRDERLETPEPATNATVVPAQVDEPHPSAMTATTVLRMQRSAGNAAIARVLDATRSNRPMILRKPNLAPPQFDAVKNHAMNRMANKFTALKPGADLSAWSASVIEHWAMENSPIGKPIGFNQDDVAQLVSWMTTEYLTWWDHARFDEVMTLLEGLGGKPEYVARLRAINDWPGGLKPRIVAHPSVITGANYDRGGHLIKVSPTLRDPTVVLDFIMFECENARRQKAFATAQKTGARAVAELEFQSDTAYAEGLKTVYRAADWTELVANLNVPIPMRLPQAFDTGKSSTENNVTMPDKSQLSSQAQRQALWYFKTEAWTNEQRRDVWIASAHGEGLGSSEEIYGKQLAGVNK